MNIHPLIDARAQFAKQVNDRNQQQQRTNPWVCVRKNMQWVVSDESLTTTMHILRQNL